MQKEVEKQEKTVVKQKQKDNVSLKKDEKSGQHFESFTKNEQEDSEAVAAIKHTYKGNVIDFSG